MSDSKVLLYEVISEDFIEFSNELKLHFGIKDLYDYSSMDDGECYDILWIQNSLILIDKYHKGMVIFTHNNIGGEMISQVVFLYIADYPQNFNRDNHRFLNQFLSFVDFKLTNDGLNSSIIINPQDKQMVLMRHFKSSEFMKEFDTIYGDSLKWNIYYHFNNLERAYKLTIGFCLKDWEHMIVSKYILINKEAIIRNLFKDSLNKIMNMEYIEGGKTPEDSEIIYNFVNKENQIENKKE